MKCLFKITTKKLIGSLFLLGLICSTATGCLAHSPVSMQASKTRWYKHVEKTEQAVPVSTDLPQISSAYRANKDELEQAQLLRLKVYKSTIELASNDFEKTKNKISATTKKLQGYVQKMDSDYVITRIPAKNFDQAISEFSKLGRVISKKIELEDVTEDAIDYQAKLAALEAQIARLEALTKKVKKVEDILKCEAEITKIRNEIEALKIRIRRAKNQIIYSTIRVWLHKKIRVVTPLPEGFKIPSASSWVEQLGLDTLIY